MRNIRPTFLVLALALVGCAPGAIWAGEVNGAASSSCQDWTNGDFWEEVSIGTVERCLEDGLIDVESRDEFGRTPLLRAATHGSVEAVEALVRAKADIGARSKSGSTPLHIAAQYGSAETVEVLVRAKANIEAREENGRTPLHAAARGSAETVEALVRAKANIEARDKYRDTPLHQAALHGSAGTVEALLRAGANARARTGHGQLPIDLAERNDRLQGTQAYWELNEALYHFPDPWSP